MPSVASLHLFYYYCCFCCSCCCCCSNKCTFMQTPLLEWSSDLSNSGEFNPFPHNNTFWRPWETSLLKTLWEKEKLLVMSNFSFFHSVFFTCLDNFLPFSSNLKLSSANSFSLEESKIGHLVMG